MQYPTHLQIQKQNEIEYGNINEKYCEQTDNVDRE